MDQLGRAQLGQPLVEPGADDLVLPRSGLAPDHGLGPELVLWVFPPELEPAAEPVLGRLASLSGHDGIVWGSVLDILVVPALVAQIFEPGVLGSWNQEDKVQEVSLGPLPWVKPA